MNIFQEEDKPFPEVNVNGVAATKHGVPIEYISEVFKGVYSVQPTGASQRVDLSRFQRKQSCRLEQNATN